MPVGAALALLLAMQLLSPTACYCIGSTHQPADYARFEIVIVDPDETPSSLVELLHSQGKIVLGYVNIGYAEDWRWYWPRLVESGIVHENAGYEGEYLVEYWSSTWRAVVENYTVEVLKKGYDGVYLDNVDAYYTILERDPPWAAGVNLEAEMKWLVGNISVEARSMGKLVYVNIGSATPLLWDPRFLSSVDGVLREETLLALEDTCDSSFNPPGEVFDTLAALVNARLHGKTVLAVEFVDSYGEAVLVEAAYVPLGITPILQPACDPDYEGLPLPLPLTIDSSRLTGTSR